MGAEIERKFLVTGRDWKPAAAGVLMRQGYLSLDPRRTVRVRIAGEHGFVTIKGLTTGISRREFEYAVPLGVVLLIVAGFTWFRFLGITP